MDIAEFGVISDQLSYIVTGKVWSTGIGQVTQSVYPFILHYQLKSVFLADTLVVACAIFQFLVDWKYTRTPKERRYRGRQCHVRSIVVPEDIGS